MTAEIAKSILASVADGAINKAGATSTAALGGMTLAEAAGAINIFAGPWGWPESLAILTALGTLSFFVKNSLAARSEILRIRLMNMEIKEKTKNNPGKV